MGFSASVQRRGTESPPSLVRSYGPRMSVLHETVFTGMPLQSFTNGQTFIEPGGLSATVSIPAGGSIAIVSGGLKCMHQTSSSAQVQYTYAAPQLSSMLGANRWRRGQWAWWTHYVDVNKGSTGFSTILTMNASYPGCGIAIRRRASVFGDYWFGPESNPRLRGTTNQTNLVVCVYARRPWEFDILYGPWDDGWPGFESLTLGGTIFGNPSYANVADISSVSVDAAGGGYTGLTAEYMTTDRWRLTTWD